ncbi:MAG: hypothetical protein ACTH3S_04925 [Marinobacter sp.]|uniref:hypothetical protein n=1 Tax=Marinobacter sp. TaxID=50741 RepID=UPI003F949B81
MAGFPKQWPECCPPDDAPPAEGVVYRICRENPPAPGDFQSHAELGKSSKGDPCMRHGLSVFRDISEAQHLTGIFPKLGKLIFRGELTAEHGKIKPTPAKLRPSHVTWWPFEEVERAAAFTVSSEG